MDSQVDKKRILVVSDMHLGRDCKHITGFQNAARPNPEFDQAFIDLLDLYTSGQEIDWRIVFAGDFIDFIEVVVVPDETKKLNLSFEVTDEEREFGLGSEAERGVIKLEMTMDYHEAFFRRVAHFVREGGEVVVMRGNHDVEFHWEKVQRVFRRRLAGLAFSNRGLDVDEVIDLHTEFQERLEFAPWFYFESERLYIEHGHQYDLYCSFEHILVPISPSNANRIDMPVSAFGMRYFVNMLSDFAAHHADIWSAKDYVRWFFSKGLGGAIYTVRIGLETGFRMLGYSIGHTLGKGKRYVNEHQSRLEVESSNYGVPTADLRQIDALRHAPVTRNLSELVSLLAVDRVLLGLFAAFSAFFFLLILDSVWLQLTSLGMLVGAVYFANRRLRPRRYLMPGPKQAKAAKRIAEILEVPLVVMGHSHNRRVLDLGEGRKYVNTGCWLPPLPEKKHVRPEEPCTCKLSHVVVENDGRAELRVYCPVNNVVRVADTVKSGALPLGPVA